MSNRRRDTARLLLTADTGEVVGRCTRTMMRVAASAATAGASSAAQKEMHNGSAGGGQLCSGVAVQCSGDDCTVRQCSGRWWLAALGARRRLSGRERLGRQRTQEKVPGT